MSDPGQTTSAAPDAAGDAAGVEASAVREALGEAREQLEGQLHDLAADGEAGIVDENFADSAAVTAEHGEQQALAARLREQLDDVEKALARLDEGTYGSCEVCGTAISEARLEVMPATRFCIDHAG